MAYFIKILAMILSGVVLLGTFVLNSIFTLLSLPQFVLKKGSYLLAVFVSRIGFAIETTLTFILHVMNRSLSAVNRFLNKTYNLLLHKIRKTQKQITDATSRFWKKTARNTTLTIISIKGNFKIGTDIVSKHIPEKRSFYYATSIILGVLSASYLYYLMSALPSPRSLSDFALPASTQIYDRNGILLYSAYADVNRVPVEYEELPQTLIDATLAAEDKNFFHHHGFDFMRIAKAGLHNMTGNDLHGASTITQQLAKNVFLSQERTVERKLKEAVITMRIESNFDKKQILELYFNTISYGGNTLGIESAAQKHFGKHVSELSKKEAVFLASLPVAPSILLYHPQKDFNYENRMQHIMDRMVEMKKITEAEKEEIQKEELVLLPSAAYKRAPSFVDYVLTRLEEKYGKEYVFQKGFIVNTSLDLKLQNNTQRELLEQIMGYKNNNITNGAVLVINPQNGDILTMIGSANYFDPEGGQYNVVTSPRQMGSAVKLLTYAAALERGYKPDTMVTDRVRSFKEYPEYVPRNYDGKEHGIITLKEAFANSYNLPALDIAYTIGVDRVADLGAQMGIPELDKEPGELPLAMTLGGVEITLEHLTQAYGVIANDGQDIEIDPFISIKDYDGNVLYEKKNTADSKQIVKKETAQAIYTILSDPNARAAMFGSPEQFDFPGAQVAIKTGTSNDDRDNTAFAFTSDFVVGTWMGNNDYTPMRNIASGYSGATSIMYTVTAELLENSDKQLVHKDEQLHP
jgi:membrane peptidoglycan carboxypeptidase